MDNLPLFTAAEYLQLARGYEELANANGQVPVRIGWLRLEINEDAELDQETELGAIIQRTVPPVQYVLANMLNHFPFLVRGRTRRPRAVPPRWIVRTTHNPGIPGDYFAAHTTGIATRMSIHEDELIGEGENVFKHPAFDLDVVAHEFVHRCHALHITRHASIPRVLTQNELEEWLGRYYGSEEALCDYYARKLTKRVKGEIMGRNHGFCDMLGVVHGYFCRDVEFASPGRGQVRCDSTMEVCVRAPNFRCAKRDYAQDVEGTPSWVADQHFHGKKLAKGLEEFESRLPAAHVASFGRLVWDTYVSSPRTLDVGALVKAVFDELLLRMDNQNSIVQTFETPASFFTAYFNSFYSDEDEHPKNVGTLDQRNTLRFAGEVL